MALTQREVVGSREVLADGQILVRTDSVFELDGKELTRTYHRHVVIPGDNLANVHPMVRRLALAEHTQAVIDSYKASIVDL